MSRISSRKGSWPTGAHRDGRCEEEAIKPTTTSTAAARAVQQLARQHREILVETYFRGRNVTEAARVLGIPLETARSRLYYAMRELAAATRDLTER